MSLPRSGAFLVDKPAGCTSADVVRRIKRHFKLSKVGHAGTLDPFATGLLPILFGSATRLQDFFLLGDKSYSGTILLGRSTSTLDLEGTTLEERSPGDTLAHFQELRPKLLERFTGEMEQIPPAISAIKVDGVRSYKRARKGETVELSPRKVTIYRLQLDSVNRERIRFFVHCSKGTYIRSLARDIGQFLNLPACLETLRRESVGSIDVRSAVPLDNILASAEPGSAFRSVDALVEKFPKHRFGAEASRRIMMGIQEPLLEIPPFEGEFVVLYNHQQSFLGIAEKSAEGGPLRVRFLVSASEF